MKKNAADKIVEVIPAKLFNLPGVVNTLSKKKVAPKKKVSEKHFKACCQVWIEVYGFVVPAPPEEEVADPKIFSDAVEMKHLKYLLKDLRERAEKKEIEWTEENATTRFRAFTMLAGTDDFISKNFLLRIINNCKTKIFNNQITPIKNGRANGYGKSQSSRNNDYRPTEQNSGDENNSTDTKGNYGQL